MANISANLVKELREKTGAAIIDCKQALTENDGNLTKAIEWLRQKGTFSADKKQAPVVTEGLVESYIHCSQRLGTLVEVNCETDFVARSKEFQKLANNIAMQIAACPNIKFIRVEDIPEATITRIKEMEMDREDLKGQPDNIKEKIISDRIDKHLKKISLLSNPYVYDQSITVEELVKQNIARLGENIQIRRFVRFILGGIGEKN